MKDLCQSGWPFLLAHDKWWERPGHMPPLRSFLWSACVKIKQWESHFAEFTRLGFKDYLADTTWKQTGPLGWSLLECLEKFQQHAGTPGIAAYRHPVVSKPQSNTLWNEFSYSDTPSCDLTIWQVECVSKCIEVDGIWKLLVLSTYMSVICRYRSKTSVFYTNLPPLASCDRAWACNILCLVKSLRPECIIV